MFSVKEGGACKDGESTDGKKSVGTSSFETNEPYVVPSKSSSVACTSEVYV